MITEDRRSGKPLGPGICQRQIQIVFRNETIFYFVCILNPSLNAATDIIKSFKKEEKQKMISLRDLLRLVGNMEIYQMHWFPNQPTFNPNQKKNIEKEMKEYYW